MQHLIHYFLHLIFPVFIAKTFYGERWLKVYVTLLLTMLVDVDHLLADPIFDPSRCSIGFHPLHSYVACGIYLICLLVPRLRILAIGLLLHMITDFIDCMLSNHST